MPGVDVYCEQCGLRNADTAPACDVCRAPLPHPSAGSDQVPSAAADMARFGLGRVLRGLAGVSPLLLAVAVPIILVRWCLARLTRARLLTPVLASITPRYEKADLGLAKDINQRSLAAAQAWFAAQGFEPVIDIEDLAPMQSVYRRILLDWKHGIYGSINVNRLTHRVHYCSLFAFSGTGYFSVDNTDALEVSYPETFVVQHVPGLRLDAMRSRLQTALDERGARGVCLDTGRLMQALYQIGQYSVHLALGQGALFAMKPAGQRGPRTCHFHPTDIAVRVCTTCGKPLCEICYTMHENKAYCRSCLPRPQGAGTPGEGPGLPAGVGFAGLGVRFLAGLLDLALALAAGLGAYAALALPARLLAPGAGWPKPLGLALMQLVAVAVGLWNLLFLPMRKGRSLGQAAWGLRVFDRGGGRADAVAFYVRFAYKLVAFLFVFPLLGYAAAVFRKDRRMLHDRLAGTVVVTHHAGAKSLLAWLLLAPGLFALSLVARPAVAGIFALLSGGLKPEVTLEAAWERALPSQGVFPHTAVTLRGATCLVALDSSLLALDMAGGDTLWICPKLRGPSVVAFSEDTSAPLLVLDGDSATGRRVRRLDAATGSGLWGRRLAAMVPAHTWDCDSGLLVGVGGGTVYAFGPDGVSRWERTFADSGMWVSAKINEGVLVSRSSLDDGEARGESRPPKRSYAYLDRSSGRVVWESDTMRTTPLESLGAGWEVFGGDDGRLALVRLFDRREFWRSGDTLGHVAAVGRFGSRTRPGRLDSLVLYTARAAVGAADGKPWFTYPAGYRPVALVAEHVFMLPAWRLPPGDTVRADGAIVLLDCRTGVVRNRVPRAGVLNLTVVGEDSTSLYVAANVRDTDRGSAEVLAVLLIVSKAGGQVREVPLGRNLAAGRMKALPGGRLLFVATPKALGAYRLPE